MKIAEDIVLQTNQKNVDANGVTRRVYQMIYKSNPPWEINDVQPILSEIEKDADFLSPVLDVGCGYGFNSKYLAEKGYEVYAIDYLNEVIECAREKNTHPNITYETYNVFDLGEKLSRFSTILDSATFHGFSDTHRSEYVNLTKTYLKAGSHIYIIGFSDKENQAGGPRRLSPSLFSDYFSDAFLIKDISYVDYRTTIFNGSVNAILAKIVKI